MPRIPRLPSLRVGRVVVPWAAEPEEPPRQESEEADLTALWGPTQTAEVEPTEGFSIEFDAEFEPRRESSRTRVDRPRMTIEQVREAARSAQENAREARRVFTEASPPPPPPKKTPMQRAAEYAARPTVYQKLLDDD